ncbi:hypothetical protein CAAN1_02S08834 [[Candida] anglica]|uniref:HTH La-type RNA-binding domain-containing protein n=1 Tax=[Candida] anglica TaxID=148631 RepID=A0ABP0EBV2_9ASCO
MSATVSYANVAAKGSPEVTQEGSSIVAAASDVEVSKKESVEEADGSVEASTEASTDAPSTTTESEATESSEVIAEGGEDVDASAASTEAAAAAAAKPKKSLAPAPVPTKSAWGSAASSASSVMDEQKWPTPDKVTVTDSTQPQKFIKPITNKWVPITAKVVLPSAKNANKGQNRNRKNKKVQQNNQQNQPQKKAQIPKKKEGEESASVTEDGHEQNNGGAQNKNAFRRYNNSNNASSSAQQFKPKYPQQSQPQQPGANGQFFHPQPFVPNYYNNRQFRPQQSQPQQNGQFRPQNRSNSSYRNGGFNNNNFIQQPFQVPQVQIPPPISPKQDPKQALVQQIDYYFSLENLIRDIFLRKNMNEEGGWVPLGLILDFKRVKIIINGIQNSAEEPESIDSDSIVLDSVSKCDNLEVRYVNGKDAETAAIADVELRVKDNYEQWLLTSN